MATIKNWVADQVKRGESVKSIFSQAKQEELTKWDWVKVTLWWLWYKGKESFLDVLRPLSFIIAACLVFCILVVMWVLDLLVFGVLTFLSLIWYPVLRRFAPKKAANLLITELTQAEDGDGVWREIWCFGFQAAFNIFRTVLGKLWGWTWRFVSMKRRQYYIDATRAEINELSVEEQLKYYYLNVNSTTVRQMSWEAVEVLRVQYGTVANITNIADVYEIYKDLGTQMLYGNDAMFELLKGYCSNERKTITARFSGYLIETFLKGAGESKSEKEAWSRVSSLVLLCCEHHTLPDHQLKMLFASLGKEKPIGFEAGLMLERYFSRRSFSDNVISQVISFATDAMADECKEKNFELLCKIVRRDGWKTALAEEFFNKCINVQNAQMTEILKIRMDCEKVSHGSDNDNNRASWEQYCRLKQIISPDAQLAMREWQYDIFHQTNHALDAEVIYQLLVKGLSEEDKSYFEKVLDEEQDRKTLSKDALKLIMMTPWKRDIILVRLEASQKLDGLDL